jgi:hypothetical protein
MLDCERKGVLLGKTFPHWQREAPTTIRPPLISHLFTYTSINLRVVYRLHKLGQLELPWDFPSPEVRTSS